MSSKKTRNSPTGPRASQKFDAVLFDGGTVSTSTTKIVTMTVLGVKATDVLVGINSQQKTGLAAVPTRVLADDVVEFALVNPTAATITTGTVTYTAAILHFAI